MILVALLLQAAAPAAAPVTRVTAAPPARFSILLEDCPARANGEVVVCAGDTTTAQRLPLPAEAIPDHGVPSNPYKTGTGALAAEASPCATLQGGCQVGFGPPIGLMVGAAVRGIGNTLANSREARARRRDGDRRRPIDLTSNGPSGRVER